jgi:hypothetical protein
MNGKNKFHSTIQLTAVAALLEYLRINLSCTCTAVRFRDFSQSLPRRKYPCHRSSVPSPFLPAHIGDVKCASNHDAVRSVVTKCRRLENFSSDTIFSAYECFNVFIRLKQRRIF